jgi:hypothetical protein
VGINSDSQLPETDQTPALHVASAFPEYPESHSAEQEYPLGAGLVHFSEFPCKTSGAAEQSLPESGTQIPETDQTPSDPHVAIGVPKNPVRQSREHTVELGELDSHSPRPEFSGSGISPQNIREQAPEISQFPAEHTALGVPEYPEAVSQAGKQILPSGEFGEQSPEFPFRMEGGSTHVTAVASEQVPVISQLPEAPQSPERVPVNPELHSGVHLVSTGEFAAQLPGTPFVISGVVAHVIAEAVQVPVISQFPLAPHKPERVPINPGLHSGVHLNSAAEPATQFPGAPFVIVGVVEHVTVAGVQVPVISQFPEAPQSPKRVPVNSGLHSGVHLNPAAEPATQFPGTPFAIIGVVAHVTVAAVQVPVISQFPVATQSPERVPVNPELHSGVHLNSTGEFAAQSPGTPFVIVGTVAHVTTDAVQVPVTPDQTPLVHVVVLKVPTNPGEQVGAHVVPLAELISQVPAAALAGSVGKAVHGRGPAGIKSKAP